MYCVQAKCIDVKRKGAQIKKKTFTLTNAQNTTSMCLLLRSLGIDFIAGYGTPFVGAVSIKTICRIHLNFMPQIKINMFLVMAIRFKISLLSPVNSVMSRQHTQCLTCVKGAILFNSLKP